MSRIEQFIEHNWHEIERAYIESGDNPEYNCKAYYEQDPDGFAQNVCEWAYEQLTSGKE